MPRNRSRNQRLLGTFALGCLLFNFPLIALFNVDGRVFGVPTLYAYLFAAWALIIGLAAIAVETDT